ncbi:phosphoglucosamine mutase [Echinicola vietnamensis]|uniref:Phosphoglucosamine mutase n=1 Tax=Echinicola vietnamensis (strain DSM 17526 / LMG 23754 / KMM 6221) TaxID=926556 RepID=L0FU72_ECHVK|nr:phosphoglucosamine mutase [Echinicola vietnamensis]AGA77449.1 phosphoglucosamine mutase [Echinicola vietnamensis DSM 17526]
MALIKSISGIRGTIGGKSGEGLTPVDIVKFTSAYGAWILEKTNNPRIVIGRDARISGDMVSKLVTATLQGLGIQVIDLGLSTTPTVEFAVPLEKAGGGIILTASHNPIQWNALKLLNDKGEFISDQDGKEVLEKAEKEDFEFATVKNIGAYTLVEDYIDRHIDHVLSLDLVDKEAIAARNFRVVIDCVNSTGGIALPKLLKALGVEHVEEMYCEPDGHFPHNPEPLPENLRDISSKLKNGKFDLGIVVDPDVDRLAFLTEDGSAFGEEYTLVAIADYVLSQTPGNTVSNLSSTRALRDVTEKHEGTYNAAAVGEVNVVNKMKETNAIIGGEGNGGVIYPSSHYGRDALVGIGLFLTHLAKFGKTANRLRASYPNYYISKNKIELTPEIDVDAILDEISRKYSKQPINDIDGIKIEFEKEWVHLRKSNTEPIIRIYSESETKATAEHLANKLILDIKEVISASK